MTHGDDRIRVRANELIGLMLGQEHWAAANRMAELMTELGFFPNALQRPTRYVEGLRSRPLHPAEEFEASRYLEAHAETIRNEVMHFCESGDPHFSDVEEPLLDRGGRWRELVFYEAGIRSELAARLLPRTSGVLDGLPDEVRAAGVVMLSRLAPDTHIVPHCGETNGRLRLHLGIKVPPDAIMRVGTQSVRWQEGRCIVFDDSYEHEVWNFGNEDRIVLIVDIPHPDAGPDIASAIDRDSTGLHRRLAHLMKEGHLSGLYVDEKVDELRLIPDRFLSGKLRRYLRELDASRIEVDAEDRLRLGRAST